MPFYPLRLLPHSACLLPLIFSSATLEPRQYSLFWSLFLLLSAPFCYFQLSISVFFFFCHFAFCLTQSVTQMKAFLSFHTLKRTHFLSRPACLSLLSLANQLLTWSRLRFFAILSLACVCL